MHWHIVPLSRRDSTATDNNEFFPSGQTSFSPEKDHFPDVDCDHTTVAGIRSPDTFKNTLEDSR
ncbi:MAG: hypothetical protein ACE5D4_10250, partial [Thermodesulfobacteriota bacterium]